MTAYLPRVANLRLALIAFTISTMRNGIASILALTRLCYMLLRTWTEWWLNIRRHIKLAPSPQHLKQEKGKTREKKGGKRNLVDCENIRKGACLIFRSLGGDRPPAEDFEPDILGIPRQETVDHETLHLFASKTDTACLRDLCRANCFTREAQEIVWDFSTLGWIPVL